MNCSNCQLSAVHYVLVGEHMNEYPYVTELFYFLKDWIDGSIEAIDDLFSIEQRIQDWTNGAE